MNAVNLTLDRKAFAETSFSTFADPLVNKAIEQASGLQKGADAEKMHKLRVALRRLRTLLWAYRPVLDERFDNRQRAVFKSLADTAGDTRNWDILIGLTEKDSDPGLVTAFRKRRDQTAKKSARSIRKSDVDKILHNAVGKTNSQLERSEQQTPLGKFARKRVEAAEKQLKKRMRHAADAGASDYASYHDVRKAGKKVRYLIEFFDPLLKEKQRKGLKDLKRLQKHFGALNDVVASRTLLASERKSLSGGGNPKPVLRGLETDQKKLIKAASKLL